MINYNLVGISGKKGAGKDTFYNFFSKLDSNYKLKKFADKLKLISSILTGQPIEYFYDRNHYSDFLKGWDMDIRTFQQKIGTEAIRNGLHENAWVMALMSDYKIHKKWVITDVRFPNEAEIIRKNNGILIRIERKGQDDTDLHSSEIALDNYKKFHFKIINDGNLKYLEQKINKLYHEYWQLIRLENIPIIL